MGRQVLFLRGVNVGGVKLPMAAFRAMLSEMGLVGVQTYIQSGNAVFEGDASGLETAMRVRFGFVPEIFLLTPAELDGVIAECPYAAEGEADGASVHVVLHKGQALLPGLQAHATAGERFAMGERALYLHAPGGIGRSELAARLPKHLKGPQTARNWRTMRAVQALTQG